MHKDNSTRNALRAAKWSFGAVAIGAVVLSGVAVFANEALALRPEMAAAGSPMSVQPVEATSGASLSISPEEAELGTMSVDEVRSANFFLTNTGTAPVEISQVGTSCMCTFAEIALPGEKSPRFNMAMHNSPSENAWTGVLNPGKTAVVTVIYQPALMPVEGSVARTVKFATNDPQNPQVELGVHATITAGASG